MSQQNLEKLKEELKPKSNYVRWMPGEKKILIFNGAQESAFSRIDEKYGLRARFIVTDVTDPIRPVENKILDMSPRWANMIINYIERNQECLEIARQGAGTDTQYIVMPATPNE